MPMYSYSSFFKLKSVSSRLSGRSRRPNEIKVYLENDHQFSPLAEARAKL